MDILCRHDIFCVPEIHKKMEPFNRIDVDNWGFFKNFPMVMTALARGLTAFASFLVLAFWMMLVMVVLPGDSVRWLRDALIHWPGLLTARWVLFLYGFVWVNVEYVHDADYKKWLGPDWTPKWTGAGTIVANHVCWLDIVTLYGYFMPAFVSKRSVEKIPGIKTFA